MSTATKIIVCVGGRCSVWGKHFARHMWTAKTIIDEGERAGEVITEKSDTCYRCGMSKKEAARE